MKSTTEIVRENVDHFEYRFSDIEYAVSYAQRDALVAAIDECKKGRADPIVVKRLHKLLTLTGVTWKEWKKRA